MKNKMEKDFMLVLQNWETSFANQLGWLIKTVMTSMVSLSDKIGEKASDLVSSGLAAAFRITLSKAYDENSVNMY